MAGVMLARAGIRRGKGGTWPPTLRDGAYCNSPLPDLQVFHDMEEWGLLRDAITYSAMISALSKVSVVPARGSVWGGVGWACLLWPSTSRVAPRRARCQKINGCLRTVPVMFIVGMLTIVLSHVLG